MGRRRKQNSVDVVAAWPWPVGVVAGLIGFLFVRYGFAGWMSHQSGPLAQSITLDSGALFAPLAWPASALTQKEN